MPDNDEYATMRVRMLERQMANVAKDASELRQGLRTIIAIVDEDWPDADEVIDVVKNLGKRLGNIRDIANHALGRDVDG